MASYLEAYHRETEERALARIQFLYPGSRVYLPNAPWKEPDDPFWFAFQILTGKSMRMNLGGRFFERTSQILQIECWGQKESGDRGVITRAETIAREFAHQSFRIDNLQTVRYFGPEMKPGTDNPGGKVRAIFSVTGYRDVDIPSSS